MTAPACPNDRPLTRAELDALAAWHDARRQPADEDTVTWTIPVRLYGAANVARVLGDAVKALDDLRALDWSGGAPGLVVGRPETYPAEGEPLWRDEV